MVTTRLASPSTRSPWRTIRVTLDTWPHSELRIDVLGLPVENVTNELELGDDSFIQHVKTWMYSADVLGLPIEKVTNKLGLSDGQ